MMGERLPDVVKSPSPSRSSPPPPITIEDLFSSPSRKRVHGKMGKPLRYTLTPRSAEAVLQSGVDPEEVQSRELESFWERGLDAERQNMRYESYNERRQVLIKLLRETKEEIVQQEAVRKSTAAEGVTDAPVNDGGDFHIEMERRRLEKIKQRQQKEMEQMRAFEIKMKKIEIDEAEKQWREAERERKQRMQEAERAKQKEEARRKKQQQKEEEEALEEKKRRELAHVQYLKDKQLEREHKQKEAEHALEARQFELDRQRKAEEHRQKTLALEARFAAEADAHARIMEENSQKRAKVWMQNMGVFLYSSVAP